MLKWIFRTVVIALVAWAWRTYRDRRAEERSGPPEALSG
jgi:hypothetical protein